MVETKRRDTSDHWVLNNIRGVIHTANPYFQ